MTDYISREAAINEIDEWYEMYPESDVAREALSMIKRTIKKLPAADVREVKRGKWIKQNGFYRCSNCHTEEKGATRTWHQNFCHFCGADMREEQT